MHKYLLKPFKKFNTLLRSTQYPELVNLLWENKLFPYHAGTLPIDLVFSNISYSTISTIVSFWSTFPRNRAPLEDIMQGLCRVYNHHFVSYYLNHLNCLALARCQPAGIN